MIVHDLGQGTPTLLEPVRTFGILKGVVKAKPKMAFTGGGTETIPPSLLYKKITEERNEGKHKRKEGRMFSKHSLPVSILQWLQLLLPMWKAFLYE